MGKRLRDKRKKAAALFLTAVSIVMLAGCGGKGTDSYVSDSYYNDYDYGMSEELTDGISSSTSLESGGENSAISESRKLVKEYYVDAETKEFDKTLDSIQKKTESLGGYIENSEISGNSYKTSRSRRAYLVIRIPSDVMPEFIETVKTVGNVTSYQESVTDITLDYIDTESHIKALETERDTLMEMLEQAGDLETLLAIQNELTNVRYELELYESAIRTYDQQVSYGTITLDLCEVVEITEQIGEESFFEELSRRFMDSVESMIEMTRELVIFFISMLPFLLPPAAVLIIILVIIISVDKSKRRKAKAAKQSSGEEKKKD